MCVKEQVIPALVDKFAEYIKIDAGDKDRFSDFVLGKVEGIPDWVKNHPQRTKVCYVKGQLFYVLKVCMKASVDKDYGFSKKHFHKNECAIKYEGSDNPKENESYPSEIKNLLERLDKTYCAYLHKGLKEEQIFRLIDNLKRRAGLERKANRSLVKTEAEKLFEKMANSEKSLTKLNEEDIRKLIPQLEKSREAIFYYLRTSVAEKITYYGQYLKSSAQNFKSLPAKTLSLSATPHDEATHGFGSVLIPMHKTDGMVSYLLLTKTESMHGAESTDPKKTMEDCQSKHEENANIKATIDIGGTLKGIPNLEIAKKICEEREDIEGVIYLDPEDEQLKVYNRESDTIELLIESRLLPEERLTYYHQNGATGLDIKQALGAKALGTIARDTTLDQAGQGVGRMRDILHTQNMDWLIQDPVAQEIFGEKITQALVGAPKILQLYMYLAANQAHQDAKERYQSQLLQMEDALYRPIMDKILGIDSDEVDINSGLSNIRKFRNELVHTDTDDTYELYAGIPPEQAPLECLKDKHKSVLARLDKLTGFTKEEKQAIRDNLTAHPQRWKDLHFPPSVAASSTPNLGLDCEVEQNVNTETQIETQAEAQEFHLVRKPWSWHDRLDIFSSGWEKPASMKITTLFYTIVKPIRNAAISLTFKAIRFYQKKSDFMKTALMFTALYVAEMAIIFFATEIFYAACIAAIGYAASRYALPALMRFLGSGTLSSLLGYCSNFKMRDVLSTHFPEHKRAALSFSPHFYVTNNFYTQHVLSFFEGVQVPFDSKQKPLNQILVIKDEGQPFKIVAIDQNDSIFFRRKLKADIENNSENDVSSRTRKVAVYDLKHGIVSQGVNKFTDEELEQDDFIELVVQAKIIAGEVNFSEGKERTALDKKAREVGHGEMSKFIEEKVLAQDAHAKNALPFTVLGEALIQA